LQQDSRFRRNVLVPLELVDTIGGMSTTAIAAIADGKGGYAIDEVQIGDPGPGEVMIAIKASGVCHTDLKVLPRWPAMIMGHEGAGVVIALGAGVTDLAAGDRVC